MPDRDDATQEGIQLGPTWQTRMVARDEAQRAIIQHLTLCPFKADDIGNRLRTLEITMGRLVGFMIGSGLLGGTTGALVAKLLL